MVIPWRALRSRRNARKGVGRAVWRGLRYVLIPGESLPLSQVPAARSSGGLCVR